MDPKDVLLPPLHIKLGLLKIFVKGMNKDGQAFRYLNKKFPKVSDAKVKEGIFCWATNSSTYEGSRI